LFEEKGALESVVAEATRWFDAHLRERPILFDNRAAAGRLLAAALKRRAPEKPVVFALPRGGAPVAAEIARALDAPLDLILSRKIGAPNQPELALGAAVDGEKPEIVLNADIIAALGVDRAEIDRLASAQFAEIERRRALYLGAAAPVAVQGRTAILVDDGIATGASMEAAIHALKRRGPQKIIVAVPVAARDAAARLGRQVDETIALLTPETFYGIGEFYRDFHQLEDEEVIALMKPFAQKRVTAGD
jgi:putative phosphoribosyl transferase